MRVVFKKVLQIHCLFVEMYYQLMGSSLILTFTHGEKVVLVVMSQRNGCRQLTNPKNAWNCF